MTQLEQHLSGLVAIVVGMALFRWATPLARAYPFYMGFDKSATDYYGSIWIRFGGVALVLGGLIWLLTGWSAAAT